MATVDERARAAKMMAEARALQERAIDRGDIHKLPNLTDFEALGLLSHIASIPGTQVVPWFEIYAGCTTPEQHKAMTAALARLYHFGYLRALDDIQAERIVV